MAERKRVGAAGQGLVLDLDNYVPRLVLWLSNKVSSSASMLYKELFGIGVTEWQLLAYFMSYPGTTAAAGGKVMGLDKGGVSRALAKLVKSGYLDAYPLGKRQIAYELSKAGRKLHDQVYVYAIWREEVLLEGIPAAERKLLIKLIKHMLANLDKRGKPRP